MPTSVAETLNIPSERTAVLAATMGISRDELVAFLERGASHTYRAGEYLFHESSPRLWLGIVQEGEVEIVRGLHGSTVHLATISPGASFSEGVMLDDLPHASSAVTRTGARVWQIPREALDGLRRTKPEAFYRAVGHIARQLSARLAAAGERAASEAGAPAVSGWRREHDLIGERELPDHVYYGVQTLVSGQLSSSGAASNCRRATALGCWQER